ncbi:MAG: cysteine--tRNA ligase [Candidatus Woesearchaeota archaeon]
MELKLYNTLTRKKEIFKPLKAGHVGMYNCGPTVYNFAHIGNFRSFIFADVLRRVILYNNYKLTQVMNITDVGHLTSDADEGEDKMVKGAKREQKTVWQIAQYYTDAFLEDMQKLNIQKPEIMPRATQHIAEMIELNKKIEANGYTYVSGGNLYFATSKLADYGKLAKLKLDDLEAGARIEVDESKKHPRDFVLWFTQSKFGNQDMQWDSPWGRGFPGWHIECSAMSSKYLGEQFDIHTGGIDHIPVHHTNEIAQSEAGFGKKPWVNYWLHGEFLVLEKEKMAKSGSNFITVRTLEEKGYNPLIYRYFCLTGHYRSQLQFSWQAMETAKSSFASIKAKILEIKASTDSKPGKNTYEQQFHEAINDDMDMPKAMSIMWAVIKDANLGSKEKSALLLKFDTIFGFGFADWQKEELSASIQKLVEQREQARKQKNFQLADNIREELKQKGIILEDTPEGVHWKKACNPSIL